MIKNAAIPLDLLHTTWRMLREIKLPSSEVNASRGEMSRESSVREKITTVGVAGPANLRGKTLVATAIANLLSDLTDQPVLLVSLTPICDLSSATVPPLCRLADQPEGRIGKCLEHREDDASRLEVGVLEQIPTPACAQKLSQVMGKIGHGFKWVVFDLGARSSRGIGLCDVSIEISNDLDPLPAAGTPLKAERTYKVMNLYNRGTQRISVNHCEPFILPVDKDLRRLGSKAWARGLFRSRATAAKTLRRLTRKILGKSVGVALGGGGALGIAHIGVLSVLDREDVPVDILAGTSIGALVALAYAAGTSPGEMKRIIKSAGVQPDLLSSLDFTLPYSGLLTGRGMKDVLAPFVGRINEFRKLSHPCRVVATDIETGERISIGEGSLGRAFQASSAVPILREPIRHGRRVLVDGSLTDPVPTGVVREMGADLCVSVNVIPAPKKGTAPFASPSLLSQVPKLNPLALMTGNSKLPSRMDVGMSSVHTLLFQLARLNETISDVQINPQVSGFSWKDFDRHEELIRAGARAAYQALPRIKEALKIGDTPAFAWKEPEP